MKKGLIIVIVIALIAVAGIVYYYYYYSPSTNDNTNQNVNVNTNQTANTNATTVTHFGKTKIDKSITYKEVGFIITTADQGTEFGGTKAESGQKYVYVYFYNNRDDASFIMGDWLYTDVKLVTVENKEIGIGGSQLDSDITAPRSYLLFNAAEADSGFKLRFGSGDEMQEVALGF